MNCIMRDSVPSTRGWHSGLEKAKHISLTQCWPRYYLIDFCISRRYDPSNVPPLEPPISDGDKHPPEHSIITVNPPWVDSSNPFPTDVHYLGSMLKRTFSVVSTFSPDNPPSTADLTGP